VPARPGGRARLSPLPYVMNRIFGYLVGIVWLGLAYGAFQNSSAGWSAGQDDVGFWWSVIAGLLTIAALGALIGTTIHARSSRS
jgi:hypothetical protein